MTHLEYLQDMAQAWISEGYIVGHEYDPVLGALLHGLGIVASGPYSEEIQSALDAAKGGGFGLLAGFKGAAAR